MRRISVTQYYADLLRFSACFFRFLNEVPFLKLSLIVLGCYLNHIKVPFRYYS